MSQEGFRALAQEIEKCSSIIILSGAGISKTAGFPTFVDQQTGRYRSATKDMFDANVTNVLTLTTVSNDFHELKNAAPGKFRWYSNVRSDNNPPILQETYARK